MSVRQLFLLPPFLLVGAFALTGCGGATASPSSNPSPDSGTTPVPSGECVIDESSTLPHVHIAFTSTSCTVTQAQAAAKVTFTYDLIVDEDVPGFVPANPYWYGSDAANLAIGEAITGGSQHYCVCDQGLPYPQCPVSDGGLTSPPAPQGPCAPVTLPAGTYHRSFTWDGKNWDGPSDTANAEGPAFPPGDYELSVKTAAGSIGNATSLAATGRFRVRVIP